MITILSVAVPILIVIIILFALRGTLFGPSKKQQQQAADLVSTGRKARAKIVRIDPTGMVVNNINIQCWVTFLLEPLDGTVMMLLPLGESSRCRKCEEMRMIVQ